MRAPVRVTAAGALDQQGKGRQRQRKRRASVNENIGRYERKAACDEGEASVTRISEHGEIGVSDGPGLFRCHDAGTRSARRV